MNLFGVDINVGFAVFCILPLCGLWTWVGVELCRITHRQRGLEVDRPLTDNLPIPPTPVVVPDRIPDWLAKEDVNT